MKFWRDIWNLKVRANGWVMNHLISHTSFDFCFSFSAFSTAFLAWSFDLALIKSLRPASGKSTMSSMSSSIPIKISSRPKSNSAVLHVPICVPFTAVGGVSSLPSSFGLPSPLCCPRFVWLWTWTSNKSGHPALWVWEEPFWCDSSWDLCVTSLVLASCLLWSCVRPVSPLPWLVPSTVRPVWVLFVSLLVLPVVLSSCKCKQTDRQHRLVCMHVCVVCLERATVRSLGGGGVCASDGKRVARYRSSALSAGDWCQAL